VKKLPISYIFAVISEVLEQPHLKKFSNLFFPQSDIEHEETNMIQRTMPTAALPSIGYAISISRGGRMSLPVTPSNYIYSHFKHVSGTPAPEGVRGVTISKLKILDVLIEQLTQIKKQPEIKPELSPSDDRIDALIEQYRSQIRQTQAANAAMPYSPRVTVPSGAVFNLVA
jgi:hypothetical protein